MDNFSDEDKKRWQLEVEGFAYFDSWDDVWAWSEDSVESISKSNTPLLQRPRTPASKQSSNVLIMHDYRGGGFVKNNYEGWQGKVLDTEEYWLEHWQRVEVFNYFAHHRVAVPPPAWVNTGHRNGALVLGTFCIEADPKGDVHSDFILEKNKDGRYRLADILERMAICYGFDGWLINIEVKYDDRNKDWDNGKTLAAMLRQLKHGLEKLPSKGKVIWYDALSTSKEVRYQNTINESNFAFAQAAGSIITNYEWDISGQIKRAVEVLKNQREQEYFDEKEPALGPENVYFGIDCFAQTGYSTTSPIRYAFGHDVMDDKGQSTYGLGHGGTATGLGVKALTPDGFSAGIFAPGYAYEHFPRGRDANRFTWEGQPPLEGTPCDCKEGIDERLEGFKQHMREDIKNTSIKLSAAEFPCGSNTFFYTDYTEAFVKVDQKWKPQLGQQSILPINSERSAQVTAASSSKVVGSMTAQIGASSCTIGMELTDSAVAGTDAEVTGKIVLHKLNIGGGKSPDDRYLKITHERLTTDLRIKIAQFITMGNKDYPQDLAPTKGKTTQAQNIESWADDSITAVGITIKGPASVFSKGMASYLIIYDMGIQRGQYELPGKVESLKLQRYGSGVTSHVRLSWSCEELKQKQSLPYSNVTGPISYFVINVNDQPLGRAYGWQSVIDPKVYEGWKQKQEAMTFSVEGHAFDGTVMIPSSSKLPLI